jgi:N-acetylmuramoyl-L-alanine amidase
MKIFHYFIILSLFVCTFATANIVNITKFRTSATGNSSRLVFDLTTKTNYVLFTLKNPDRLVLDIKNAHLTTDLHETYQNSLIKNFRMHLDKKYLRIVMDLTQSVQVKSFLLHPKKNHPYRLVIDLTPIPNTSSEDSIVLPLPVPKKTHEIFSPASIQSTPKPTITTTLLSQNRNKTRNIIIVIDPGHGGKDPGTTGPGGVHEKNVVLAIARYLQQALNSEPGFRAVLTRNGDYYIPLRGRLNIARQDKADMFVSIHADAFKSYNALGASVFALSERGATSEAARWLAEKENSSELLGGASLPDKDNVLRSVLIDLSQTNTISESLQIGTSVLRELDSITVLHHSRVEQAAFVVLKSPDIPSLLIETGFLSTPRQEQQLRNPRYQRQLANAIMEGIKSYFVHNPPPGTWLAGENANASKYARN